MAKTGRLTYIRLDKVKTTCYLYDESDGISTDYLDICGAGDPLSIKWNGNRYETTMQSLAQLKFIVDDLTQRVFLENIFNGGYILEVHHGSTLFWKGKVQS